MLVLGMVSKRSGLQTRLLLAQALPGLRCASKENLEVEKSPNSV